MISRVQGWRRSAALAAIAALFFHAVLFILHTPAQAATNNENVVLCTSLGLASVAAAELGKDGPSLPSPQKDPAPAMMSHCPVCLGAQLSGLAVLPIETILPQRVVAAGISQPIQSDTVLAARLVAGSGARAPPSIV